MEFNKEKCKVLHLVRKNNRVAYRIRESWPGIKGKGTGSFCSAQLNHEVATCDAPVRNESVILVCNNRSITLILQDVIVPFYSALIRFYFF